MKKIINGRMYNTETAEHIANGSSATGNRNDFSFFSEDLYRKKTGEFFLYGEGHAMTKYATHNGNSSSWGDAVIPLDLSEAKAWVERYCNDEYETIFGKVEE